MSDASQGITGQVIRFDGERLSIVRHPEIDTAVDGDRRTPGPPTPSPRPSRHRWGRRCTRPSSRVRHGRRRENQRKRTGMTEIEEPPRAAGGGVADPPAGGRGTATTWDAARPRGGLGGRVHRGWRVSAVPTCTGWRGHVKARTRRARGSSGRTLQEGYGRFHMLSTIDIDVTGDDTATLADLVPVPHDEAWATFPKYSVVTGFYDHASTGAPPRAGAWRSASNGRSSGRTTPSTACFDPAMPLSETGSTFDDAR